MSCRRGAVEFVRWGGGVADGRCAVPSPVQRTRCERVEGGRAAAARKAMPASGSFGTARRVGQGTSWC
eukprot:11212360-Lingulodinium_polyedra.AAC.1